jgi:GTPase SAR1 family protein
MGDMKVYPGKHPNFRSEHFTRQEIRIIDFFAREFYVTNGGREIRLGATSEYKYIIVKPTLVYEDMFNLDKEIIVVFSKYKTLEARTLDAFEYILKQHNNIRIDKICNVLVSCDKNVEDSLVKMVKSEPESQVVIPFSYEEFDDVGWDDYFFRNRFRKYFYSRDLFAFEAPLKRDIYFFGRTDLIQEVVNRLKCGENSGLFGLRKTGKTSLINGIIRSLSSENIPSFVIDCQDTSFNQRRWNNALYYFCKKANECLNVEYPLPDEKCFTLENASVLTENFLKYCNVKFSQPILVIFDEIENISRETSPSEHWSKGLDFVLFWQTLRSIFQRGDGLISYLIVGTNPSCIESPRFDQVDNPIFNHFAPMYIPGFEVKDTRDMVRKLGRRMGLCFDEGVYTRLTEDFGGHPFLMRHVCSLISKAVKHEDRPVTIDRSIYSGCKKDFVEHHSSYLDMIMSVLLDYYPDEFDMLKFLAVDETDVFREFAQHNPSYTTHLIGYGLISKSRNNYDFKIDSIKEYLKVKHSLRKINTTDDEKRHEISQRRNSIEIKLRRLIMMLLKARYGEVEARNVVLSIMGGGRKIKYSGLQYANLFNPKMCEIYFSDLAKIISKEWDCFAHMFNEVKKEIFMNLEFVNSCRIDAHASSISESEFKLFRVYMDRLEADLVDC